METLNDVKKRIKSVQGIAQMTGAMQLVSAAKKRRSLALRDTMFPFFEHCVDTMGDIMRRSEAIDNPFFTLNQKVSGQTWKIAYFVLCGDQGLAGSYNNNIVKTCEEHIQMKILDNTAKGITTDYKMYVFGKIARERLLHLGYNVDASFSYPLPEPTFFDAQEVVSVIKQKFLIESYDLVYLVYTHLESALNMKTDVIRLAPVDPKSIDEVRKYFVEVKDDDDDSTEIQYYPNVNEVFSFLIDTYLNAMVYGMMTDAYACEQTARFAAMDNATNSAEDMMKDLELKFNRARQAKITNELTEIINGASQVDNL
ncbi:MAG: ATP synthase F1 subunit gamma [Clostridiales bacterium]|nr:ATP synthase F1 subunit gamma [Clostridiales bacterium]